MIGTKIYGDESRRGKRRDVLKYFAKINVSNTGVLTYSDTNILIETTATTNVYKMSIVKKIPYIFFFDMQLERNSAAAVVADFDSIVFSNPVFNSQNPINGTNYGCVTCNFSIKNLADGTLNALNNLNIYVKLVGSQVIG